MALALSAPHGVLARHRRGFDRRGWSAGYVDTVRENRAGVPMDVVAGLTLKNLKPAVWNAESPEYLANLRAVMLSFDEFRGRPAVVRAVVARGIHAAVLKSADGVRVFLDNGAFACLRRGGTPDIARFKQFVRSTAPHWYPVPADYIPLPTQSVKAQRELFRKTVGVMRKYAGDGYCPVVHAGPWLSGYTDAVRECGIRSHLAVGGLVPHLLNSEGAQRKETIRMLAGVRREFPGRIHAFGLGGIVTLHLGAALGFDSADSSGWRQRAARGLVVLRGRGERQAVKLGSWKGRELTDEEWAELARCRCPACRRGGNDALRANGIAGFVARATHNLAVTLDEADLINRHLAAGDFPTWSRRRVGTNAMANLVHQALDEAGP
jgi:7-cyano-7-deazaguanine tRNA-ribosyltransferase